jgi:electron transport complex protein RnfB
VDAIVGAHKLMHTVIARECTGCELCLPPCPVDCIAMIPVAFTSGGGPWPEYPQVDTARWRRRTEKRLERLARNRQRRARNTKAATVLPNDRKKIRADIRAAIERVKARKKNQM